MGLAADASILQNVADLNRLKALTLWIGRDVPSSSFQALSQLTSLTSLFFDGHGGMSVSDADVVKVLISMPDLQVRACRPSGCGPGAAEGLLLLNPNCCMNGRIMAWHCRSWVWRISREVAR